MALVANEFTSVLVLYGIEFLFIWLIITPLIIYHMVNYYKQRHIAQLNTRHTSLSIAMAIAIIIYTTAGRSVALLRRMEWFIGNKDIHIFIDTILYIVGSYTLLNILLWRMFMLNFKIRYTMMIEKGEWMRHINAKSAENSNWYYTHRMTVGNLRWMMRWFIPILCIQFILCFMTSSVLDIVERIIYYATISLFDLIIVVSIWVIYCKTPQFADVFALRNELKYILCIGLLGFFSWVLTAVVEEIAFLPKEGTQIWVMLNEIILDAVFCAISLISTHWVLKNSSLNLVDKPITNILQQREEIVVVNLARFLSTKHGIYSFMSHLCKEFSSENLLFIYECLQFKKLCGSEMDQKPQEMTTNEANINRRKSRAMIVLPEGLPTSDIVSSDNILHDKFKVLTEKYVLYSAEFEVNLPYGCMQCILQKYQSVHEMSRSDLYSVFDEAIEVITGLMNDSYSRFMRTQEYITALSETNLNTPTPDMH